MKELTAKYDVKITLLDFDKESKKLMKKFSTHSTSAFIFQNRKHVSNMKKNNLDFST